MNRRASSHDVAKAAGVSQSTVSLVLSGKSNTRISEPTRARVLKAAAELNYSRNAAARALVTGRTHRIGVVPIEPSSFLHRDMYYGDVLTGIMAGAMQNNYNLLLHAAEYTDMNALYQDILGGAADGVLLIGRPTEDILTERLLQSGFPTVCISYQPGIPGAISIDCDNDRAAVIAAEHLLSLGHRQIGYVTPGDGFSWAIERRIGAEKALERSGFKDARLHSTSCQYIGSPNGTNVQQLAEYLNQHNPRITALIYTEEAVAQTAVEGLPAYGFRIPQDIAVIGFNSTVLSARCRPPLTSVYQPLHEIGATAVRVLCDRIERMHNLHEPLNTHNLTEAGAREPVDPSVRFQVRLDVRESCGAHLAR